MNTKKIVNSIMLALSAVAVVACNSGTSQNTTGTSTQSVRFYADSQARVPLSHLTLNTHVNQVTKQAVFIKNTGDSNINLNDIEFDKYISGLKLANSGSCGSSIAPGQVCSFTLEFKPTTSVSDKVSLAMPNKKTLSDNSNGIDIQLQTNSNDGPYMVEYWCGFGSDFCGQSSTNDVNPAATHVVMAFANVNSDGGISVDSANWPTNLVTEWQNNGQQVLISVGGQNVDWTTVFANPTTFVNSVAQVVQQYNLNGVDLDIENGMATPQQVSDTINILRQALGESAVITIAPQNVGVYQASSVPPSTVSVTVAYWNFFVPVLESSINSITLVMQQDYNNWYGGSPVYNANQTSVDYIGNSYLNWVNSPLTIFPSNWGITPISGFDGVPMNKLIIGIPAAESAAMSGFYPDPQIIQQVYSQLESSPYNQKVAGFMMWDSHYDTLNNNTASNAVATTLGLVK